MGKANPLSSFGLPGQGAATWRARDLAEAVAAARKARRQGLPVIPIGEGTNCAFLESAIPAVFLRSRDRSLRVREIGSKVKGSKILVSAGAGLPWDALVRFAVGQGWGGAECLSGIPGTCGAAPVQNIGAYGASLADILESVEALDLKTLRPVQLSRAECGFGYRSSIFNGAERGRFFVSSINLRFGGTQPATVPNHPELLAELSPNPPLMEIRNAVLRIRRRKLPDYKKIPNCGSFFKNPIVAAALAKKFLQKNPGAPHWPEPDHKTKLSAGWLIENSGVRNKHWGKIRISPQHALILTNEGEIKHAFLKRAIADITMAVKNRFGILLEPEPNLLSATFAGKISKKQF
jgi:UDP-N-acetylmuramate dehydrogenase